MRDRTRTARDLVAALQDLSDACDQLLDHLRVTDRLLRVHHGRIGPSLLGLVESAATRLGAADRARADAVADYATVRGRFDGRVPTIAELAAGDEPWIGPVVEHASGLHAQVASIDLLRASLRQAVAMPSLADAADPDTRPARRLLRDAFAQTLDELVPPSLRHFLSRFRTPAQPTPVTSRQPDDTPEASGDRVH